MKRYAIKSSDYQGVNEKNLVRYMREHLTVINDIVLNAPLEQKSKPALKKAAAMLENVKRDLEYITIGKY